MTIPQEILERVLAYAAGELDADAAGDVESLLARDREAADALRLYRAVASTAAQDDTVPAPSEVLARARAIFRARPAAPVAEAWLDRVAAILARLVFDSRLEPAPVRYSEPSQRIQLAYEVGDLDVDLEARRLPDAGSAWTLSGQISGERPVGAVRAAALRAGTPQVAAEIDADARGRFRMDLARGRYDIMLRLPQGAVMLPGVTLE